MPGSGNAAATDLADNDAAHVPVRVNGSTLDWFLVVVFMAALAAATIFLCVTVTQPILEAFGFRQAQTALTTYWFLREGYELAYQTPVLGYPWAVPFELPLFQATVAAIASFLPFSLDSIGRTVSFGFFLATLVPIAAICRTLGLGGRVFFVFGSLYLLSPQYLFWGRTFMIESAATFFSVATVATALPLFFAAPVSAWRAAAVMVLGSLAMTVKVTTMLPVLAVLTAAIAVASFSYWRKNQDAYARKFIMRSVLLAVPVLVALAWTHFTDVVKMQNEFGKLITSSALHDWNFGEMRERVSKELFADVIWTRSFKANAGGILGVAIIGFFLIDARRTRLWIGLCLLALFLLPLFVFTHLHIFHSYYQSANIIYLVLLLAVALVYVAEHASGRLFAVIFALVLLWNVAIISKDVLQIARRDISLENNVVLAAANVVREQSPADKPILVYGHDWSSELPYYAQRKALAVPDWYNDFEDPLRAPQRYFGGSGIGALVICGGLRTPAEEAVQRFLTTHGSFRTASTASCRIFISS